MNFLALIFSLWLAGSVVAEAADEPAKAADEPAKAAPAEKCLIAEVNPVTGAVYCIKPPGAPVEAPPAADTPCKPHARMQEEWTWQPNCKP
jgi:hypothetical protein